LPTDLLVETSLPFCKKPSSEVRWQQQFVVLTLKVLLECVYRVVGYNARDDRGDRYIVARSSSYQWDGATFLFILFVVYLGYYLFEFKAKQEAAISTAAQIRYMLGETGRLRGYECSRIGHNVSISIDAKSTMPRYGWATEVAIRPQQVEAQKP
jgi:hypothetical protein